MGVIIITVAKFANFATFALCVTVMGQRVPVVVMGVQLSIYGK